jgi:hypothetical protein
MKAIDVAAKHEVTQQFGLPASLHLPIGVRNKAALEKYLGKVVCELSRAGTNRAFLMAVPPPKMIDQNLNIWKVPNTDILHKPLQVWVHVAYTRYRAAYQKAFPTEPIYKLVLDHIMNRQMARLKGFEYVRIIPISRSVNSSGAFSEKWGIAYHSSPAMQQKNALKTTKVQYADLGDLVKMLNINPGGGVMDAVNLAQQWLL